MQIPLLEGLGSFDLLRGFLNKMGDAINLAGANATNGASFNELNQFEAKRTVTWVAPVGNQDTTVFTLPARSLVTRALIVVETLPVAGAGLTSTQVALGTAAGGQQFLLNKNFVTAGLPAAGTVVGTTVAEVGASLTGTVNGVYFPAAQDVFLRITNAGGAAGTTAGSLSVYVTFTIKP
jgi:hypothetical protein